MSQIDDGGAAFPNPIEWDPNGQVVFKGSQGMTLRDWLAGQALQGLMVNYNEHPHTVEVCAEIAYHAADAMLAARLTERK